MALNVLFDFDSMVYKCVWYIVDRQTIKNWFYEGKTKEWMSKTIVSKSIDRLTQMSYNLYDVIEETGIELGEVEYYLTACKNSIRKQIYPEYKANREKKTIDLWVTKVRKSLLESGFAVTHDQFEADDLIHDRAIELGEHNCLILSLDKDLKQIPGIHFNYYEPKTESQGNAFIKKEYIGLELVTKDEANYIFWLSMLTGDMTDNIKGCKGIGIVKGKKILEESQKIHYETAVKAAYKKANPEHWLLEYEKNYRLLKLGSNGRNS